MNDAADLPGAYDFLSPPAIRFVAGRAVEVGEVAAALGQRGWLVGGKRSLIESGQQTKLEASLQAAGLASSVVAESAGEPTVAHLAAALARLPQGDRSGVVVVAVGGGSTIDLAKALAALATNVPAGMAERNYETAVLDHLEGVGRGLSISRPPLPCVALPTTAGTGAEATRNAVISCPIRRIKKSMRSPLMVPRAVIVDPDLTLSCDRATTASAGLDCITQLIESFVCRFRRPLPRSLVLDALPRAVAAFPSVLEKSTDAASRAAMSHAALLSGMALTNSGLGMAHGVAAALGIECGTPHGIACALLLPVALSVNREACEADFATLERSIDPTAAEDDAVAALAFTTRIEELCTVAGVPRRLAEVGLERGRIGWLADHSGGASMRGNPVELPPESLRLILEAHY